MNGGREMPDVWKMPSPGSWERTCGKHPTQKTLRLLYRILKVCTEEGFTILDPFAGSCTTGIAANLLGRKFIGIDQSQEYLNYGIRRRKEIEDPIMAQKIFRKMSENPDEVMVIVNHTRKAFAIFVQATQKGRCSYHQELNVCNMRFYIQMVKIAICFV